MWRRLATVFAVLITLVYPLAIWFGQGRIEPRFLAGILLLAGLTRLPILATNLTRPLWLGGTVLLVLLAIWFNALLPLKFYPVFVNAALLSAFVYSLIVPPSMIERIARLREPELPAIAMDYTRRVTQVWCIFFAINGAIALITVLWATEATWTLYNGFIAYLLMGLLFAGEYSVRWRFRRRHHG
jgi:uncharacterized membrane protein